MFETSFKAPFKDPEWLRKVLLGGLLDFGLMLCVLLGLSVNVPTFAYVVLIPIGLFPKLAAWGYLYRIFIDGLNAAESSELPHWRDWKQFSIAGLWLFLIVLGYAFLAVVGLIAFLKPFGVAPTTEDPENFAILVSSLLATFAVLSAFFPIAFARFAAEGKVWAAFDPGSLLKDIREVVRADYLQACFAFFFLWLVGNVLLSGLPYIGLPLVSIYLFYIIAVFARIFGRVIGVEGQQARRRAQLQ